jgi:hypothetical protein
MKKLAINSIVEDGSGHKALKRSEVGDINRAFKAYKLKDEPTGRKPKSFFGRKAK